MYISAANVLLNRVFDGFKYIPIVFKNLFCPTSYFIPASFINSRNISGHKDTNYLFFPKKILNFADAIKTDYYGTVYRLRKL